MKDADAYARGEGVCYIGENAFKQPWWEDHEKTGPNGCYWLASEVEAAGVDVTGAFTRADLLDLCEGREELALYVFALCDWQHPSTVMDELDDEDWADIERLESEASRR